MRKKTKGRIWSGEIKSPAALSGFRQALTSGFSRALPRRFGTGENARDQAGKKPASHRAFVKSGQKKRAVYLLKSKRRESGRFFDAADRGAFAKDGFHLFHEAQKVSFFVQIRSLPRFQVFEKGSDFPDF
jgi:hypothetical protein